MGRPIEITRFELSATELARNWRRGRRPVRWCGVCLVLALVLQAAIHARRRRELNGMDRCRHCVTGCCATTRKAWPD